MDKQKYFEKYEAEEKAEEKPSGIKYAAPESKTPEVAVLNYFDALYEERCYKEPIRPVCKIMQTLKEGKGTQFDPELGDIFVKAEQDFSVALANPEEAYKEISILRQFISQNENELSKEIY